MVLALSSTSVFALENYTVRSQVKNLTGEELLVGVTANFIAKRNSIFCKNYSMPDGQGQSRPKTTQRVYFMKTTDRQMLIPMEFDFCRYVLTNVGVNLYQKAILTSLESSDRAEKMGDGVYEIKGSMNSIGVDSQAGADLNTIKCQLSSKLSLKCDKANGEILDSEGVLNLSFEATK